MIHEDDLRALIRDAIAQHIGIAGRGRSPNGPMTEARSGNAPYPRQSDPTPWHSHLSHGRFVWLAPTDPDAPCVVEPQVRCHHCGFCQSYGH